MQRDANKVDFAGDGPVSGIVGIAKSGAESEGPVVRKVVRNDAERFCLRSGYPPVMTSRDRVCRCHGSTCAGCSIVIGGFGITYNRRSEVCVCDGIDERIAFTQGPGARHSRDINIDVDNVGIVCRELQRSVVACRVNVDNVRGTQTSVRHRVVVKRQIDGERR